MEISMFEVYMVMEVRSVGAILFLLGIATIGINAVFYFTEMDNRRWKSSYAAKPVKRHIVLALFGVLFMLLSVLVPSTKTLVAMYGIPQLLQSEEAMKLPTNTLKALNKVFETYIEDK